jgi:glycosyltransferase involved in cell wall biosynthesis
MNICFASLNYPLDGRATSGVGSQVQSLAQSLVKAGHSVSVIDLATNSENCIVEDRGVKVYRMRSGNLHWFVSKLPLVGKVLALPIREIEYSIAVCRGIRRAGQTQHIDLIEGTETGALLIPLFSRQIPLIIRLHGERYTFHKNTPRMALKLDVRLSRAIQRFALRRAKLLISPSRAHAQEIARELRYDPRSLQVIPHCIDLAEIPSSDQVTGDGRTVLFVGRLERVKGISLFLEAAELVVQECPTARFLVAGANHPTLPHAEIDQMIRSYSLQEHVERLGHVPWHELVSLYREASVCAVPSHYESFGLVALEAMACGVPVVAARAGGLPEIIEDGMTGLLVPAGDTPALAKAIVSLLKDRGERTQMGSAGRERARTKFSVEENSAANLCLYKDMKSIESAGLTINAR